MLQQDGGKETCGEKLVSNSYFVKSEIDVWVGSVNFQDRI